MTFIEFFFLQYDIQKSIMDCKSLKKLITQNKREVKKAQKALDKAMKDYEKCKKKEDDAKAAKKKAKKTTVAQKRANCKKDGKVYDTKTKECRQKKTRKKKDTLKRDTQSTSKNKKKSTFKRGSPENTTKVAAAMIMPRMGIKGQARMNTIGKNIIGYLPKRKPKFIAIAPTPKETDEEHQPEIPLPLNSEIDKLIKNKFIPGDVIYVGGMDFDFDYGDDIGPWRFIEILKFPVKVFDDETKKWMKRNWKLRDFSFSYVDSYYRNDAIKELTDDDSASKMVQHYLSNHPEVVYPMSKRVAEGVIDWMTKKGKEYSLM